MMKILDIDIRLILLILLIGCFNNYNSIQYVESFIKGKEPFIYITGLSHQKGVYKANIYFVFSTSKSINTQGLLYCRNDGIYIKIKDGTEYHKYFDFKNKINEPYYVTIEQKGFSTKIEVKLEKVAKWKMKDVYKYRFKNTFLYFDQSYDMIFLVTKENGIIGSYFSGFHNNKEYMVGSYGNILDKVFDYSDLEKRVLK